MADEGKEADESLSLSFSPSFDLHGMPVCFSWSAEDVAKWIAFIGFPQYKVSNT